jgi:hypothetical protein
MHWAIFEAIRLKQALASVRPFGVNAPLRSPSLAASPTHSAMGSNQSKFAHGAGCTPRRVRIRDAVEDAGPSGEEYGDYMRRVHGVRATQYVPTADGLDEWVTDIIDPAPAPEEYGDYMRRMYGAAEAHPRVQQAPTLAPRPSDEIRPWPTYGVARVNLGGSLLIPAQHLQLIFSAGEFSAASFTRYERELQAHVLTSVNAPQSWSTIVIEGVHPRALWDFVRRCPTGVMARQPFTELYDELSNLMI